MAITALNQRRNELAKQAVNASTLNADAKADLDELLDASLAGTNGLDAGAKLDAVADNLYQLTRLTCVHLAEKPRAASWKDVIISCRRELAVIGLGLVALFALRPQIALAVERIFGG